MADIAFLHTSPVHVSGFDALLSELAPQLRATHLVREDLLARAQSAGLDDPGLIAGLRLALLSAAEGARVVVCTCSTLGGLAEALPGSAAPISRIDRAMADAAVQRGAPVLVVAALQSTIGPTQALLQSSAERLYLPLRLRSVCLDDAWPHFQAGRREAYLNAIAAGVRHHAQAGETVVLAQASMADAAPLLADTGLHVLSSPRLGVANAVQLCGEP